MAVSEQPTPFQNWEAMEQATQDVARIVWRYYSQLLEEGFDEAQAFGLTIEYQRLLFKVGGTGNP